MKYIIEIAKEYEEYFKGILICGIADEKFAVDVIAREDLEELTSDYTNEHFGDMQDEAYQEGYKACMSENDFDSPCTSCEAYQRGLDDAWEAAKKIFGYEIDGGIPINELRKVFGYAEDAIFCTADIIRHNTASEAIAKLKAYEEQKADDEIKVGDEVISLRKNGEVIEDKPPWIVTYETLYSYLGLDASGLLHNNPKDRARKTGRHFDIDKILEEMRND